jgi:hypothetical protein
MENARHAAKSLRSIDAAQRTSKIAFLRAPPKRLRSTSGSSGSRASKRTYSGLITNESRIGTWTSSRIRESQQKSRQEILVDSSSSSQVGMKSAGSAS